jgi:PAS domain S-box-containing protein
VLEELAFTYYISVYDLSNLVGHYLKITSYFLLYLALVRTSLKKPYETLYREIDESEKKFKSLFEEMSSGVALHEIILNKVGKPIDYRFLDINSAFDELTGLTGKDLIGKTVLQVLPNTEEYWIDTYGQVALTGKSVKLDHFSKELNKHFEVNVYCPQYKQFVTVFNDITKQKTSEIEKDELISKLQKAANEINTLRGILPICSYCKQIRDDKGYWNQLETYIGERSDVDFSHSICPTCAQKHYPEMELYDD